MGVYYDILGLVRIGNVSDVLEMLLNGFEALNSEVRPLKAEIKQNELKIIDIRDDNSPLSKSLYFKMHPATDDLDICIFSISTPALSWTSINTSIVLLESLQWIIECIRPIFITSIISDYSHLILKSHDVNGLLNYTGGIIYLSNNLLLSIDMLEVYINKKNLYRLYEEEYGYLIASPFGAGNEHPHYFIDIDGNTIIDAELDDYLSSEYDKHMQNIKVFINSAKLRIQR